MGMRRAIVAGVLLLWGCGHEEPRATVASSPEAAEVPAPPTPEPAPEPAPPPPEVTCETPHDCVGRTRVCPRAHRHNTGNCMRPYLPTGEHMLGVCQEAHCEVDDAAECEQAAARCIGGGTATFQAYDPPNPEYRRGGCTVRCTAYPEGE